MKNNLDTYKPKAFISCSIRAEDKSFVELVESIVREQGLEPMGTVGRHTNYAEPISKSMVKEIKKADVFVMAATPRYFQAEIINNKKKSSAISEMLHVESGMAAMENIPTVVFVKKGTHVGNFIPGITQYFELDQMDDLNMHIDRITILFDDIKKKVSDGIQQASQSETVNFFKRVFMWIGIWVVLYKIIVFLWGDEDD